MIKSEYNIAKTLMDEYGSLTEFQALQIACRIRHNEILIAAHEISLSDSNPPALTAIALALGYKPGSDSNIQDSLNFIADTIHEKE